MSLADRLKEDVSKKKIEQSSEETLRNTFNEASSKLINQFMADVLSGSIKIDDVGDLSRLFQIYMSVNDINENQGAGGTLPELSSGQKELFGSHIETTKTENEDGEEEETINLSDLEGLEDDSIDKMLQDRELEMNKENEGGL